MEGRLMETIFNLTNNNSLFFRRVLHGMVNPADSSVDVLKQNGFFGGISPSVALNYGVFLVCC